MSLSVESVYRELKSRTPLSSKFSCIGDEVYIVCVGDWIYLRDRRREKTLRRVDDPHDLIMVVRNYGRDVVSMVDNPDARSVLAKAASRVINPVGMYTSQLESSLYISGALVEFNKIVVFSDAPRVVYLVKDNAVVGYIDLDACGDSELCRSAEALFSEVLKRAEQHFNNVSAVR